MIYLLMGVMGCGKTTIGAELARRLNCPFHDGDDYHSEANRLKMKKGIPLTDEDREPWLNTLRAVLDRESAKGGDVVLACSALREKYRKMLVPNPTRLRLVHLKGSKELIADRIKGRKGSFAHPSLLDSQFEALEEPRGALVVDISQSPAAIVEKILST